MHELRWANTPFDTLTVHLTSPLDAQQATSVQQLAVAAWMAVIGERLDEADTLLAAARAGATDRFSALVLDALEAVLEALAGRGAPDGGTAPLDALAAALAAPFGPLPPAWAAALIHLEAANWFTFFDRLDEAGRLVDLLLLHADGLDDPVARVWTLCCRTELDLRRGRWQQAASAVEEALELSGRHGMAAGYAHSLAARVGALRGCDADAADHLAAARSDAFDRGDRSTLWRCDAVEGLAAVAAGDGERAVALLGRLFHGPTSGGPALASVRQWDADLVEALVHLDQRDEAALVLKRLGLEPAWPWSIATVRRSEALLAPLGPDAVDAAIESAERFARIGAPFEAARSELVAGELARRARQTRTARALLTRALTTFEGLGAPRWAERARRELAASGAATATRPGPAAAAGDTAPSGPVPAGSDVAARLAQLTAQERQVVRSVTAGASNREIAEQLYISIKTVETHLTRAYRKLQVHSRTQLAALFRRAEL